MATGKKKRTGHWHQRKLHVPGIVQYKRSQPWQCTGVSLLTCALALQPVEDRDPGGVVGQLPRLKHEDPRRLRLLQDRVRHDGPEEGLRRRRMSVRVSYITHITSHVSDPLFILSE